GHYSIISDYLGTPVEAYDEQGHKVWSAEFDVYGRMKEFTGEKDFIPFRYQGQYEDVEIGLYYNRFRYYDPVQGNYTQIDPIGLAGGNPTLYAYVSDPSIWIDPLGLSCKRPGGYKTNDVDAHKNLSPQKNRAPGHANKSADSLVQSHHFIQQEWVRQNLKGASKINRNSPAILVRSSSGQPHAQISRLQNLRRANSGYNNSLKSEFNIAYREMVQAGVSKKHIQRLAKEAYKYFNGLGHI
ncbi:RHS repeat-associated core domain-containing protein, partial [Lysinibacillus fusiformis]